VASEKAKNILAELTASAAVARSRYAKDADATVLGALDALALIGVAGLREAGLDADAEVQAAIDRLEGGSPPPPTGWN
jgi:hypothetical protein